MSSTAEQVIKAIQKVFPTLEMHEEGNHINVTGTESGVEASDGFSLFDYWNEDHKEVRYVFGVHKEIRDILDEHGWYAEWNNPGHILFFED